MKNIKLNVMIKDKHIHVFQINDVTSFYHSDTHTLVIDRGSFSPKASDDLPSYKSIKKIIIKKPVDTSRVVDMSHLFSGLKYLTTIKGLDAFNTKNVEDMSYMFANDINLSSVDLDNFNVKNVHNMDGMFNNDKKLVNLNLTWWKPIQKDLTCNHMFSGMNHNVKLNYAPGVFQLMASLQFADDDDKLDGQVPGITI